LGDVLPGLYGGRGLQLLEGGVRNRKARRPTKAALRAMGASPGLLTTRYAPDGERAVVEELVSDDSDSSSFFTLNRKHTFVDSTHDDETKEGES
jgi:hypothetical protein